MSAQTFVETKTAGSDTKTASGSKAMLWTGRVVSTLSILFFLMDAVMKFVTPAPPQVVEAMSKLGYPVSVTFGLGIVLLISTILYAVPRTAVLGAILLTGYLGGACSTHVRVQDGAFNTLFPVVFGLILWGGLYLRDSRVRALIPLRG